MNAINKKIQHCEVGAISYQYLAVSVLSIVLDPSMSIRLNIDNTFSRNPLDKP